MFGIRRVELLDTVHEWFGFGGRLPGGFARRMVPRQLPDAVLRKRVANDRDHGIEPDVGALSEIEDPLRFLRRRLRIMEQGPTSMEDHPTTGRRQRAYRE